MGRIGVFVCPEAVTRCPGVQGATGSEGGRPAVPDVHPLEALWSRQVRTVESEEGL